MCQNVYYIRLHKYISLSVFDDCFKMFMDHRRVQGGVRGSMPLFLDPPFSSVTTPLPPNHRQMLCKLFLICLICSLGQHFTDIKGSKYMLVHSLASKYARFVVLVRLMYWTPPSDHWTPLLKSDDLFFREPRDIGPPPFNNPGHANVDDKSSKKKPRIH